MKLPYYPISSYYRSLFGEKVYKISVSIADSCPNRENPRSGVCVFCDEWGGAAYHQQASNTVTEQIKLHRNKIAKRYGAKSFLVYFQAYTSTFTRISELDNNIAAALEEEGIIGVVIATRPDCLPHRIFELLKTYRQKCYVSVELGVQSFFNVQLAFLQRGHTAEKSIEAIQNLWEFSGVDIGIHLMFGLPNETRESLIETAKLINTLPISNVKLHNLHVLKGTLLEEMYHNKKFMPVTLADYSDKVGEFLQHLSPDIAVQRLAATANRWDDLVAPEWTRYKMKSSQFIIGEMKKNELYQGQMATCTLPRQIPSLSLPTH